MAKETKNNSYNFSESDVKLIKDLLSLPEDHIDYTRIMNSVYGNVGDMKFLRERMNSVRRVIADKDFYDAVDDQLAKDADAAHTSSESYKETKATNMGELQQVIYNFIRIAEFPVSRSEISHHTGICLQSVCARVRELILSEKIRVEGTKIDKNSQRKVSLIVVRVK